MFPVEIESQPVEAITSERRLLSSKNGVTTGDLVSDPQKKDDFEDQDELHQDDFNQRMNSSDSSKSSQAKQLAQQRIE